MKNIDFITHTLSIYTNRIQEEGKIRCHHCNDTEFKMNDPNLLRFLYGVSDDSLGKKLMWAAHMSLFSGRISYPKAKLYLVKSAIKNLQEAQKLLEDRQQNDSPDKLRE